MVTFTTSAAKEVDDALHVSPRLTESSLPQDVASDPRGGPISFGTMYVSLV